MVFLVRFVEALGHDAPVPVAGKTKTAEVTETGGNALMGSDFTARGRRYEGGYGGCRTALGFKRDGKALEEVVGKYGECAVDVLFVGGGVVEQMFGARDDPAQGSLDLVVKVLDREEAMEHNPDYVRLSFGCGAIVVDGAEVHV